MVSRPPPTVIGGAAFGAGLFLIDAQTAFTGSAAKSLGATWVNVPFPWSLPHYAAGAVLVEVIYRLLPLPLLGWLVGRLLLRGRGSLIVFLTLALLTSLLEPAGLLAPTSAPALALAALATIAFGANVFEAFEMKRHGWAAPIVFRLSLYGVWHVVGPYLLSPASILYPGPH